ncbi:transposase domain-containing protein [Streptomyces sp. NPDC002911]
MQRRLRDLPSRVGIYFLLAMCLFPEVGYRLVQRGKRRQGVRRLTRRPRSASDPRRHRKRQQSGQPGRHDGARRADPVRW